MKNKLREKLILLILGLLAFALAWLTSGCTLPKIGLAAYETPAASATSAPVNGVTVTQTWPSPSPEPASYTVCQCEALNIRSGPGMSYSDLGELEKGERVTVIRRSNGWAQIGAGRWVRAVYLC